MVQNPPTNAGDESHGFDPWVGKIPGAGHGNPWTEEPGRLQSMGSQSQTRLKRLSTHSRISLILQPIWTTHLFQTIPGIFPCLVHVCTFIYMSLSRESLIYISTLWDSLAHPLSHRWNITSSVKPSPATSLFILWASGTSWTSLIRVFILLNCNHLFNLFPPFISTCLVLE